MGTSLREIYQQLKRLENTPSTNEKIDLLKEYLKNPIFCRICWCTYTSTLSYNIQSFPTFSKVQGFADKGWEHILPILKQLSEQQGADNAIKAKLFLASSIDAETYDVVERICNKDLKCGIAARTINKARPNTVKIWSYKRCATSKHIDNIVFEPYAIAQCKADGSFANCFIKDDNSISFFSRKGSPIRCLEHLKSRMKHLPAKLKFGRPRGVIHAKPFEKLTDKVYQGEIRFFNPDGTIMPRKQGNGLVTKAIKGTLDAATAKRAFFTTWIAVPIDEFFNGEATQSYSDAFYQASCLVHRIASSRTVQLVKFENVKSLEEAYSFYRKMRSEGEEGAIIKNLSGIWEDNQEGSRDDIKIKHSFECDLKVVGWNYGKKGGRFENTVGSIDFESECGKLKVNVSGLLDSEREWDWDMMVGTVCTVEAESVITSKSKSTYSLYTPSFIEPREDKDVANTLEEIIEIAEESKTTRRRKA